MNTLHDLLASPLKTFLLDTHKGKGLLLASHTTSAFSYAYTSFNVSLAALDMPYLSLRILNVKGHIKMCLLCKQLVKV